MTTHFKGYLVAENGFKVGDKDSSVAASSGWSPATSTITVGEENATVINVAIQFNDAEGNAMTTPCFANIYFSTDAAGQGYPTLLDTLAIGTDGTILNALEAGLFVQAVSEADGDLDLDCTRDATTTMYLNLVAPDGTVVTSDVLTFTASG